MQGSGSGGSQATATKGGKEGEDEASGCASEEGAQNGYGTHGGALEGDWKGA